MILEVIDNKKKYMEVYKSVKLATKFLKRLEVNVKEENFKSEFDSYDIRKITDINEIKIDNWVVIS